jgi:hypothetical protein
MKVLALAMLCAVRLCAAEIILTARAAQDRADVATLKHLASDFSNQLGRL